MVSELVADRARRPHPEGWVLALPPVRCGAKIPTAIGDSVHAADLSRTPNFWKK